MPLPNDFNTGDGLNTAGYRWTAPQEGVDVAMAMGRTLIEISSTSASTITSTPAIKLQFERNVGTDG